MPVLARLLGANAEDMAPPGPDADFWYSAIDAMAGGPVTVDAAMRVSAVYACVTVLTEDVASLDLNLFREVPNGKESAAALPLARKLRLEPNALQTSFEWREMAQGHILMRGDSFNYIRSGDSGFMEELIPLHPDRMKVFVLPNRTRVYKYRDAQGDDLPPFLDREIFHIPGRDFDGTRGKSVLTHARESIGVAASAERAATTLFKQGLKAPGLLSHPGELSEDAYKRLRETFADQNLGVTNWGKPILLEDGLEWKTLGMTAADAEFVNTYKLALEDIARYFRMPPHKIGILDRATFSNIEHQGLDYVLTCLRAWLVRWQQRIKTDLIFAPGLVAEFDVEPLLRGDMKSRYEAHAVGRQWGWENADEIRADFGKNPLPGGAGAKTWRPMNMANAEDPTPAQLAVQRQGNATAAAAPAGGRAVLLATELATRIVREEIDRVSRAAKKHATDPEGWTSFLADFYGDRAAYVSRSLHVPEDVAQAYVAAQLEGLRSGGVGVMETWLADRVGELAELAVAA